MSRALEQSVPPSLTDLLNSTKRNLGSAINCVQIGIIQSFDIATQSASIQLAIKRIVEIKADGTRTYQELPILLECPCMVLFGGNSFLSMPIAAGDNCIVLFNDREIDQWYVNGGVQAPFDLRMHSLSDAIAIVGIRSLQNSIADYLADGIRLSYSSSSRIDLTEDLIESIAELFKQNGNMEITGDLLVGGDSTTEGNHVVEGNMTIKGKMLGNGGTINIDANVIVESGNSLEAPILKAGNGANGSFNFVTVVNGIVTGGS